MFLEKLDWRYAVKKMDSTKTVAQADVDQIIEAIRMAPTSSGLQPFELLVITNDAIRAEIQKVAWNQAQITEGSYLLVFAAWDTYTEERIDAVMQHMAEERGGLTETLESYYTNLKKIYLPRAAEVNFEHAARQSYIALGFAMAAAAELGVDCTPMEGFDPAKVDEILGLSAKGLRSVTLLPLGVRAETGDWLKDMPKVRKSKSEMVSEIA